MTEITQATAAPPAAADSASKRIGWVALGAIVIAAAALRLHALSAASLWFDEFISWHQASQSFPTMITLMTTDAHPPLFNTILHFFILAFGDSEAVLRLPSALLGIAAVAAIFWTASLIDGRTTGILAASLLCLSGFHIHYSQEARPYALLTLIATLFAGTLIRALETNRRGWHAACALAGLLLLYSHVFGGLLWFCLGIAVLASARVRGNPGPKILARWARWQAMALLLFLPWAGFLAWQYEKIVANGFWIQKPSIDFMLNLFQSLGSGWPMALALLAATALAFVPLSGRFAGDAGNWRTAEGPAALRRRLLIAWLLGPLLLGLIASLISQPILQDRYVIGSLPAWLILASMGFCRLSRMWGKWVVVLAIVGAMVSLYFHKPLRHENARTIVAAYIAQAEPGDCVFATRSGMAHEIRYYLRDLPPCFIASNEPSDIKPWAFPSRRAWLFLGYDNPNNRSAILASLPAHGWGTQTVKSSWGVLLLLAEPAK